MSIIYDGIINNRVTHLEIKNNKITINDATFGITNSVIKYLSNALKVSDSVTTLILQNNKISEKQMKYLK